MNALDRYTDFRTYIASQFSEKTQTMVDNALCFAEQELSGKTRYDGSPMLDHGVMVARIVAQEIGLGRNSTIAAIVHDVVRIAVQSHDSRSLPHTFATSMVRRRWASHCRCVRFPISNSRGRRSRLRTLEI